MTAPQSRRRPSHTSGLISAALVMAMGVLTDVAPARAQGSSAEPATAPGSPALGQQSAGRDATFLRISGADLVYAGRSVRLRGVNHNNIPALCSRYGKFNFGSCKIKDINLAEDDYRRMSELGVNHVRFGLSYRWFKDDRETFFRILDAHVAMARRHRLWIVWNLFTTPGDCYEGYSQQCPFWGDGAEQSAFREFWVALARHYVNEPAIAAYGLLNEPTPPIWASWMALAQSTRDAITEVNPRAIVAVASTSSASFPKRLDGDNILYEIHDYLPMALTHAEDPSVTYPGEVADWDGKKVLWNRDTLLGRGHPRANLSERLSINWAKNNRVPLYIGEWGSTNIYSGYIAYIRDRASLYTQAFDISHAFYTWRSDAKTYGLFPYHGPLVTFSTELLDAAVSSWSGSERPQF